VFEQEPPPAGHSLFMAPHVAGVTREAVERMSEQTAHNILSVLDGPCGRTSSTRMSSADRPGLFRSGTGDRWYLTKLGLILRAR
jgi:phosphoglycerate dehydrogenase-like enzyme